MLMLHQALQKLLQIFFDNFQSDFRSQQETSNSQIYDVEQNRDILQFKVASLYKLPPIWVNMYVCIYFICIYTCNNNTVCPNIIFNHNPESYWIFLCFIYIFFRYESFSISCELTYVLQKLSETMFCENISTALSQGNTIQCNRM